MSGLETWVGGWVGGLPMTAALALALTAAREDEEAMEGVEEDEEAVEGKDVPTLV